MTCRLAALVTLALSCSLPQVTLSASPLYSATATSDTTTASWSQESYSDTSSLMMVTTSLSETSIENSTALSFHATTVYPTGAPGLTTMESVTDSNETTTTSTFDGATDSNYTTSSYITEVVTDANATTISFQTETSSDSNETTITSVYDTTTYLNYTTDASDPTSYHENVTESNYTTDIAFNLTSPSPTTTITPRSTTTGTTTTTTPDPIRCGFNNVVPPQGVDSTLTLLASRNVSYKCNPGFVETGKGASAIVCTGGLWVDASGQPGEVKQGLVCKLAPTKEPVKEPSWMHAMLVTAAVMAGIFIVGLILLIVYICCTNRGHGLSRSSPSLESNGWEGNKNTMVHHRTFTSLPPAYIGCNGVAFILEVNSGSGAKIKL